MTNPLLDLPSLLGQKDHGRGWSAETQSTLISLPKISSGSGPSGERTTPTSLCLGCLSELELSIPCASKDPFFQTDSKYSENNIIG